MFNIKDKISSKIENAFSNWEFYPFDIGQYLIDDYKDIVYDIEFAMRTSIYKDVMYD